MKYLVTLSMFCLLIIFSGCASSGVQITLLPEEGGKVGTISMADYKGTQHTIDKPYAALDISQKGEIEPKNETQKSVDTKYAEVLNALPPKRQSYLFYFGFDSAVLNAKQMAELRAITQVIRDTKIDEVVCIGHSDSAGDKEYNKKLSLQRAQSVANALIKDSIEKSLIKLEYYGDANPLDKANTKEANAKNRRVEIILK
ncbi:MAG: OmpA family protein [Sulfurospirillaceae bacterium]|nr:OmpA family protein [Sulfurospirillaceae bacterium]MDD2826147.1 OmpA family protein [Sulfurospirillaceae bacterium]